MSSYEKVHTMTEYNDGPRRGIADFEGRPHLYVSEWDNDAQDFRELFVLSPVDDEAVFRMALEDFEILRRWEQAFEQDLTTIDTQPALPQDRARHDELD